MTRRMSQQIVLVRNMSVYRLGSLLSLLALLLGSCSRERQPVAPGPAASATTAPRPETVADAAPRSGRPSFVLPYPRAAWRLATTAELDDVVLWFSQILIRHADVRKEVSFNVAYWYSVPPPATRSRDQALELAQRIAQQAARNPAGFADLAREHSEDLPRRDEGGVMGGVQASQIEVWPQVLDTLAALAPGQTSQVVESHYGFHIFYRAAPPPEQLLSGAHIVIGHDRAQWLGVYARGERPTRSREEALALAREVYAQARSDPRRFAELVNRYSEHRDAVVAGDFGAWSTREPIAFAPRMTRLRELDVGEVGAPIETHLGFEIVQRTAPRPRAQFRARLLVYPPPALGTKPPNGDGAEPDLLAEANALVKSLGGDPARFEQLAANAAVVQWEDGRGIPGLSLLLPALRPGEVASSAVHSEHGPVIAQRLEPVPVVAKQFATELPAPEQPDVVRFLGGLSASDAEGFLRATAEHTRATLALTDAAAERLRNVHELRGRLDDNTLPEARVALYHGILEDTRQLLPADLYARYRAALNEHVRDILLGAPADSPAELGL